MEQNPNEGSQLILVPASDSSVLLFDSLPPPFEGDFMMELAYFLGLEPFNMKTADTVFSSKSFEMQFSTVEFDEGHQLLEFLDGRILGGGVALRCLFLMADSSGHLLAIKVRMTHLINFNRSTSQRLLFGFSPTS